MSLESTSKIPSSTPVANTMTPARAAVRGGRAISSTTLRRPSPSQQKTWQPIHGIVFQSSPVSISRISTAAVVEAERDLLLNSTAEDNYVVATTLDVQPPFVDAKTNAENANTTLIDSNIIPQASKYNELPESTSSWKISEEMFRAAQEAKPLSPASYWTYQLYRRSILDDDGEPVEKKVTVHYCKSKHTSERVMQNYFMNEKVLGFDIEWSPDAHKNMGPRSNVSLIQIASEDRIALFHVALFAGKDLVPPSLKKVMEDPGVSKLGVSIKADCTRVRTHLGIDPRGIFELSHLFKLVKFSESKDFKLINKKLVSLANQVQEHLHLPLFKGGDVRSSDWSKALSLDQIRYAASDSYAAVQLFNTMELKRNALDPTPPRPFHAELNKPIRIAEGLEIETDTEDPPNDEPSLVLKRAAKKKASPYPVPCKDAEEPNLEALLADLSSQRPSIRQRKSTETVTIEKDRSKNDATHVQYLDRSLADDAKLHAESHFKSVEALGMPTPSLTKLTTFYLWHNNPDLSFVQCAQLRDPPLSLEVTAHRILKVAASPSTDFIVQVDKARLRDMIQLEKGIPLWMQEQFASILLVDQSDLSST
ncbi:hypothetical protein BGZ60DRAFT_527726 [Tricladium varicosporioides]|nr:hypothetical protein BGZ60DRAFT_527726 [Hymenoscyphus varicosporioides]